MATESPKLSLWTIENALVELIQAREEVTDPQEIEEVERALQEYIRAEVAKVDRIVGFMRHAGMMAATAREESNRLAERARIWERRVERVRTLVQDVMEQSGKKRLEGEHNTLKIKGNGGLAPLVITDEAQVPEECCKYVGWIGGELWGRIKAMLPLIYQRYGARLSSDLQLTRTVDNERTRDRLKSLCSACYSTGEPAVFTDGPGGDTCPVCGGSGTEPVPGARLGERGSHLEVK